MFGEVTVLEIKMTRDWVNWLAWSHLHLSVFNLLAEKDSVLSRPKDKYAWCIGYLTSWEVYEINTDL